CGQCRTGRSANPSCRGSVADACLAILSPVMASEAIVETTPLLGRLSWAAIPADPIVHVTFAVVVLGGLAVLALLTKYKMWGYLWKEWFTTVDHKKIGIMYMILGLIMFLRGFADALMMRLQQAMAFGGS